ncbi:putative UAA transporter family protein [Lyophyllum shimeji]|uniref:UDP-galactose transporter homolog 1 n=1 Tax=Lyophyllum shimeji TaxID=47721 RepID=A0A9P3PMF0_LYOSH|nr:putative UAA transporter family protein [Lyophyllum shimeji]
MALIRLIACVGGVYSMFLLWAIAQERLSVPFKSLDGTTSEKFKSPLFMGTCQSALSALSAFIYIMLRRKSSDTLFQSLGLEPPPSVPVKAQRQQNGTAVANGNGNKPHSEGSTSHTPKPSTPARFSRSALLLRYLQCSVFITSAAPFGFAALSYISYPAMVLGKSCKLVPVMIMNVLLYRRRFAPHKYLVVFMVTTGITIFMGLGPDKGKAKSHSNHGNGSTTPTPYANLVGIAYLLINLLLDGATNSTQDEIFSRHKVTGQQMMFWINVFCTLLTSVLSVLPLPYIPVIHPSNDGRTELAGALDFVSNHPSIITPLAQFALTGALGQLFIFETLQHFGSLTLVTITLTRKLFTMLLSVLVYGHKLTPGQWLGAAVVFAGISVEAFVKRKEVHAKRVIQEKEKAKIKSL